jgi:YD repeat-containing protein
MKSLFTLVLFFLSSGLIAQPDQGIKKAIAPKNPIAFSYIIKHFGLKGKVKSFNETSDGDPYYKDSLAFDNKGNIKKHVMQRSGRSIEQFNYNLTARQFVMENIQDGEKLVYTQKLNQQGEVTESSIGKNYKITHLYNDKGLLSEKKVNNSKSFTRYEYNENGQLTREIVLNNDTIWSLQSYQYLQENNMLLITLTQELRSTREKLIYKYTYDSNGLLKNEVNNYAEVSYTYELDKMGNWISMIIDTYDLKTEKTETATWRREFVYY